MVERRCAITKVVRPFIRYFEPFLDQRFGFRVEAGRGFVQNQNARVGQDGAGDGDALALAAGEFHAALADDGVVLLFEILGEFVHARDAAGFENLFLGRAGAREGDVFFDGAVEQERVLQHHAQLRAVAVQAHCREVHAIDEDSSFGGDVESRDQADDGGFAGARGAHQRGDGARLRVETDVEQHLLAGFVGEADVFENHFALDGAERHGAVRVFVLGAFLQNFVRAVEPRERFRNLRADADDAEYRRHQERQQRGEGEEPAQRERAREDLPRADDT